ncbi:Imm70 family immunity protein [Leptospira levettii]|uniref:Imm70 family immunity protein n=1 Tax=Leptospira levettii TaxID=2023178 RepID=UPI00223D7D63|nr:Imm70 family immunity protein [Leptospira levettii]MCW7475634.1 immunity 70 family protein [Leptospira levettii]
MSVGFILDDLVYFQLGHPDFVHSFFSTICYRLEKKIWGNKYPILMKELYSSKVDPNQLELLKSETISIQKELKRLKPSNAIWDIENINLKPPWGDKISHKVTNLENYFATPEGNTFIEILLDSIDYAQQNRINIKIKKI